MIKCPLCNKEVNGYDNLGPVPDDYADNFSCPTQTQYDKGSCSHYMRRSYGDAGPVHELAIWPYEVMWFQKSRMFVVYKYKTRQDYNIIMQGVNFSIDKAIEIYKRFERLIIFS